MIEWCIFASFDLQFLRYLNILLIFSVLWMEYYRVVVVSLVNR
jgi:hypothetical protein